MVRILGSYVVLNVGAIPHWSIRRRKEMTNDRQPTREEVDTELRLNHEYHNILAKFMGEHPEIVDIIFAETTYLNYSIFKAGVCEPCLGIALLALDLRKPLMQLVNAVFIQGYYRAYQKLQLDKLDCSQPRP